MVTEQVLVAVAQVVSVSVTNWVVVEVKVSVIWDKVVLTTLVTNAVDVTVVGAGVIVVLKVVLL